MSVVARNLQTGGIHVYAEVAPLDKSFDLADPVLRNHQQVAPACKSASGSFPDVLMAALMFRTSVFARSGPTLRYRINACATVGHNC